MLEIDWDSEDDRHRRRRKASTIHGWLCMWRGTLAGNERVRQRGRREMKDARAARAYYRQRAQESGGSGPFSLFRFGSVTRKANAAAPSPPAPAPRQPQRHRSHDSQHHHHHHHHQHSGNPPQKRPPPVKRKSSSRHVAPARQEPMRQRSSHSAKSRPNTSRRPSSSRR